MNIFKRIINDFKNSMEETRINREWEEILETRRSHEWYLKCLQEDCFPDRTKLAYEKYSTTQVPWESSHSMCPSCDSVHFTVDRFFDTVPEQDVCTCSSCGTKTRLNDLKLIHQTNW